MWQYLEIKVLLGEYIQLLTELFIKCKISLGLTSYCVCLNEMQHSDFLAWSTPTSSSSKPTLTCESNLQAFRAENTNNVCIIQDAGRLNTYDLHNWGCQGHYSCMTAQVQRAEKCMYAYLQYNIKINNFIRTSGRTSILLFYYSQLPEFFLL